MYGWEGTFWRFKFNRYLHKDGMERGQSRGTLRLSLHISCKYVINCHVIYLSSTEAEASFVVGTSTELNIMKFWPAYHLGSFLVAFIQFKVICTSPVEVYECSAPQGHLSRGSPPLTDGI